MKIKLKVEVVYDIEELMPEIREKDDDYPTTFESIREFVLDRFVDPNFDPASTVTLEVVE